MLADREITAFAEKMRRVLAGTDEFPDQWVRLRKRWARHAQEDKRCGARLRRAYEEANGTVISCD